MYWFELWREFKLSLAEIYSFFPEGNWKYFDQKVIILEWVSKESIYDFSTKCGWSIKIFELEKIGEKFHLADLLENIYAKIHEQETSGKIEYGVNFFGRPPIRLSGFLPQLKTKFKNDGKSSRFLNQNFLNLSSAIIWGNKIVETGRDINVVFDKNGVFVGKTIWVQDIESYWKRDFWKSRDMQVGMLPPKLAQTMILLAWENAENVRVYDPFCWLGTVLIESVLMGNTDVFGSDLNPRMVEKTFENLEFIQENFPVWAFESRVVVHDAMQVVNSPIITDEDIDVIVTEWYLWDILTQQSISLDRINLQKKRLLSIYESFFSGLTKSHFHWNIVMCIPFWEFRKKYVYFDDAYKTIKKYCHIQKLLPKNGFARESLSGSLMYKRDGQLVGREIFKLKIK